MSNDKTGGQAFPVWELNGQGKAEMTDFGMTLRDYFAAKALPMALEDYRMTIGRIGECLDLEWDKRNGLSSVAAKAYEMADAMLEARK